MTTAKNPSLKYEVSLRDINADIHHLIVAPLKSSPHLLDRDDEASEQGLKQLTHGLLGLLVGAFNHQDNSFINQLMVEMRNF